MDLQITETVMEVRPVEMVVEAEAIMVVEEVSLEEGDRHIMIRHGWC
jgi:hypothetical protein